MSPLLWEDWVSIAGISGAAYYFGCPLPLAPVLAVGLWAIVRRG